MIITQGRFCVNEMFRFRYVSNTIGIDVIIIPGDIKKDFPSLT
jgi:hypothetical protein